MLYQHTHKHRNLTCKLKKLTKQLYSFKETVDVFYRAWRYLPVEPKPPSPRLVSDRLETT